VTFTLYVDGRRWREHQDTFAAATPGLVPVAKGNGYGFGNRRLAAEAARLRSDTIAVGTPDEVDEVAGPFAGHILVLTPWDGRDDGADDDSAGRIVRTVSHAEVLGQLAGRPADQRPAYVVELLTSMHRHGLRRDQLGAARELGTRDFAVHLPIDRPPGVDPVAEVDGWLDTLRAAGLTPRTLWVSHLTPADLGPLRERHPDVTFRPRIATALWLGDPGALQARGRVLDVQPLRRGERYGYRQRRAPRDGHVVVVGGGTAHGVGLEAPKAPRGAASRAKQLARGTLESAGLALSPYTWAGRKRWFAEPPHMQVSMLWLPGDVTPPALGDELACEVRMTILHPDAVVIA
jgi:hypothetical protein